MRGSPLSLKFVLAALLPLVFGAANLWAGLTLVQRETFQGVGTLNAATPGNLGTVSGASTFYKRAVGPRVAGDTTANSLGWSADIEQAWMAMAVQTLPPTTYNQTPGTYEKCFDFWLYLDAVSIGGSNTIQIFSLQKHSSSTDPLRVTLGADGMTLTASTDLSPNASGSVSSSTVTPTALPLRTWINVRAVWQTNATANGYFCFDFAVLYRLAGQSGFTQVAAFTDYSVQDYIASLTFGPTANDSGSHFNGRLGMPSSYSMATWTDRTTPVLDVVDPPARPFNWYVNAATGSDANDGTTAATAWQSVAKINAESQYCGMFSTAAGYANGDTLTIDTTTANLVLDINALTIQTQGLNVVQVGAGELQAWKTVANTSFSLVSGATKTYQHTLTESAISIVPWENDKWLNHVTAASFTGAATANYVGYANVTAALEALPGSFWTDGTTLYVHPFGDTNPLTDGKTYTRSVNRVLNGIPGAGVGGGNGGGSAVQLCAPDLHLNGLAVRKTALANMSTNDPVLGYCIQSFSSGGTTLIENCVCAYGSKHIYGFTDVATARRFFVTNCTANQGSPYAGAGGQTPWVDYSSVTTTADNQTTYTNCTTAATLGLIGSAAGTTFVPAGPSYLTHNNGGGYRQFSLLRFVNCNFDSGFQEIGSCAAGGFQIVGTTCGGGAFSCAGATVDRSKSTFFPFVAQGAGFGVSVTNSLVTAAGSYAPGTSGVQCTGSASYIGCTVDMRGVTNSDGAATAFLYRNGALNLTWCNSILLSAAANTVVGNAMSTDTLNFSHNAYQTTAVLHNYDDGTGTGPADRTLAQWQALGQDAGSLAATNLGVLANDSLSASSPAIDLGQNVGPAMDYTGTLFQVRNDAGAYEYPLPALRRSPAATQAPEGTSATLTVQVAGNGPFAYQWQCNGVAIPGATAASLTLNAVLPGQSGSYTVTVTNAQGSITAGPAALLVSPLSFSAWQSSHFTPAELGNPAVSGPLADPDGDGVCNLLEYAFGGDPRVPGGGLAPVAQSVTGSDGKHLAITYRQLINTTELVYVVGVSSDLATWDESQTQISVVGTPQPTGDGHTEQITAQITQPITPGLTPRQFLRVKVIDN